MLSVSFLFELPSADSGRVPCYHRLTINPPGTLSGFQLNIHESPTTLRFSGMWLRGQRGRENSLGTKQIRELVFHLNTSGLPPVSIQTNCPCSCQANHRYLFINAGVRYNDRPFCRLVTFFLDTIHMDFSPPLSLIACSQPYFLQRYFGLCLMITTLGNWTQLRVFRVIRTYVCWF